MLANKRVLLTFDNFGMDGMRCDVKGNLYIIDTAYQDMEIIIGIAIHFTALNPFTGESLNNREWRKGRISPGINTEPIV